MDDAHRPYNESLLLWLSCTLALLAATMAGTFGYHSGFLAAQAFSRHLPAPFWESMTALGDERMLLALLLPFCWRYPRVFWGIVVAAVIAGLACHGIKTAMPLPRPAALLAPDHIVVIGQRLQGHSLPAGHAASLFAFAGILVGLAGPRLAWSALVLAGIAGFSRVAVGAHWPLDVMAGAAIGLLAAWLALKLIPHWDWGLRPLPFHFLIGVIALATATLPFDGQGYPGSRPLRIAVCLWGLGGLLAHYWRRPVPGNFQILDRN